MTTAVYRNGNTSLAPPLTQNTAAVLEFNCMYTHDFRRKAKRWQDGFLRFHTFNKRIMVYDIPRNLVGDTHWKESTEVHDGDEVILESEGVIVQVAECIRRTETDLTELKRSAKKGSSDVASSSPVRAADALTGRIFRQDETQSTAQPRHISLNTLLGTKRGHIGKAAVPTKSPFEKRYAEAENIKRSDGRAAKRMRLDANPVWSVTKTTVPVTDGDKEQLAHVDRTPVTERKAANTIAQSGQQRLNSREIIDLSTQPNNEDASVEGLLSSFFPQPESIKGNDSIKLKKISIRSSSPAFQRQTTPDTAALRTADHKTRASNTPNVSSGRKTNGSAAFDVYVDDESGNHSHHIQGSEFGNERLPAERIRESRLTEREEPPSMPPPTRLPSKTLRMRANGSMKKTLLCEDQVTKKPSKQQLFHAQNASDTRIDIKSTATTPSNPRLERQRRQLQERLARIERKHNSASNAPETSARNEADPVLPSPTTGSWGEPAQFEQIEMPLPRTRLPDASINKAVSSDRQPRGVVSEANANSPPQGKRASGKIIAAPSPKAIPKNTAKRSASVNISKDGPSTVVLGRHIQSPAAPMQRSNPPLKIADPWSREAFDLLTWRPPGWDEEAWCFKNEGEVSTI